MDNEPYDFKWEGNVNGEEISVFYSANFEILEGVFVCRQCGHICGKSNGFISTISSFSVERGYCEASILTQAEVRIFFSVLFREKVVLCRDCFEESREVAFSVLDQLSNVPCVNQTDFWINHTNSLSQAGRLLKAIRN